MANYVNAELRERTAAPAAVNIAADNEANNYTHEDNYSQYVHQIS